MKFEFAFEKLLEHKKRLEDEARRVYNEAQSKVDSATREIKEMYESIDRSRSRAGELSEAGGAQAPQLGMIDAFIAGQGLRITRQREVIRALASEAERLLETVVAAAQERKTLETLREKRLEAFKKARKKKEVKEIDELVVTRFRSTGDGN